MGIGQKLGRHISETKINLNKTNVFSHYDSNKLLVLACDISCEMVLKYLFHLHQEHYLDPNVIIPKLKKSVLE